MVLRTWSCLMCLRICGKRKHFPSPHLKYISVSIADRIAVAEETVLGAVRRGHDKASNITANVSVLCACKKVKYLKKIPLGCISCRSKCLRFHTHTHKHFTRDADFIGSFVTFRHTGIFSINVLKCRAHKYYMRNTFTYAMRVCSPLHSVPDDALCCVSHVAKNGIV